MSADLHCHSRLSDGSLASGELAALAKRRGIRTLAVSDHDTVAGLKEAAQACESESIAFIPAVEISGYDYVHKRKAHVLGYLMDRPEEVGRACLPMLQQRQEAARWMVERLAEAGYPLDWEFVVRVARGSTNVYKQHIMHALMETGCSAALKGDLYRKLFAQPEEGFPGGIAYRDIEYMDVLEAVRSIKQSGGIAVLAHPAGYRNLDLIPQLVEYGLDGLEAWHPLHSDGDVRAIQTLARQYGLLLTGGSDFHGMYEGKVNQLGSCTTPEEWVEALYKRKEKG